ncbi:MAG: hypothetical protein V4498_09095 [candidate division FCPU426 bacterium]
MKRILVGLVLVASLGCHRVASDRRLDLAMSPPALIPGRMVQVTAKPVPASQMAWVSGTVKVFGFPTVPFARDPKSGDWRFKTMIPSMALVPAGMYEVKAWGENLEGQRYEGNMEVEVK